MTHTITIKNDVRKIRRDINKTLGNDLKKYIAEIITNSDDSYKRLESNDDYDSTTMKPIFIKLLRKDRKIFIIDRAEGISREDLERIFGTYGADTSGNERVNTVRGMFGQGATDVMFSSKLHGKEAKIISFKDGHVHECDFILSENDETRELIITNKNEVIDILRKSHQIPQNGTAVLFGIPDSIQIGSFEKLASDLEEFFMLRLILANEKRLFMLYDVESKKEKRLFYDQEIYNSLDQITLKEFSFKYKKNTIKGTLDIRFNPKKTKNNYFLIYEQDIVFDNQPFDQKTAPGMEQIEGRIKLDGAIRIIREELNTRIPEEIINDNRDGFNRTNDFFKELSKSVEKEINLAREKVIKDDKPVNASLKSDKNFQEIMKQLNKFLKEELQEIPASAGNYDTLLPPSEGIRFVRQNISITLGKKYSLGLLINTDMIAENEIISIDTYSDCFTMSPRFFKVPRTDENPLKIDVQIQGVKATDEDALLEAQTDDFKAKLFIKIIENEIHYPKYGIEFFPNVLQKKPNIRSKAKLYVDINKYPIGTTIDIINNNHEIIIPQKKYILENSMLVSKDIAEIVVEINGGEDKNDYLIYAEANKYKTKLRISVREKAESNVNKAGHVSDITYNDKSNDFVQSYYNPLNGIIYINSKNPINHQMLIEWFEAKNPKSYQKKYIAELCSVEVAKLIVKKKSEKGEIEAGDNEEYYDALLKEKIRVYDVFLKFL